MMFSLYFIGLNSLLDMLIPSLEVEEIRTVKLAIWCATSLCLAGGPIGLLLLISTGIARKRAMAMTGAILTLLGLTAYLAGSVYIHSSPDRALKQYFTPSGSALITIGMLLMTIAVIKARVLSGWRAASALLVSLYFPLQFPFQVMPFLGKGRGPQPMLLGVWGFFWLLLGYAIRSYPPRLPSREIQPAGFEESTRRTDGKNEPASSVLPLTLIRHRE